MKKPFDDPPGGFKKNVDDGPIIGVKKIRDDVLVIRPPSRRSAPDRFDRAAASRPSCWRRATTRPSPAAAGGTGDFEAAAGAALAEASASVEEARRNVVALQTSLTWAISQLTKAQESYDALAASLQG